MIAALFIALHLVFAFPIVLVLLIFLWQSELMIEEKNNQQNGVDSLGRNQ